MYYPLFPSSLVFKATINPPTQNITKILIKSSIRSLDETRANVIEKNKQIIRGPHKSQCFS